MAKQTGRPESGWTDASIDQVADLRSWALGRAAERHADGLARWVLSLGTTSPAHLSGKQRAFYRKLLDRYGPPRPVAEPRALTDLSVLPPVDETVDCGPVDAGSVGGAQVTAGAATSGSDGVIRFRRVGDADPGASGSRAGSR